LSCPVKLAVYIHDIIPLFYTDRYPGGQSRLKQTYFEHIYAATIRRAQVIFTNTAFSKSEIEEWAASRRINFPPVVVAGYGFSGIEPGKKEDSIVVFIRAVPHKRPDLTIQYMDRWLNESGYDGKVKCIGSVPSNLDRPRSGNWEFLGTLSRDETLRNLASSKVAVHFSEYEGFGMPPVEAVEFLLESQK